MGGGGGGSMGGGVGGGSTGGGGGTGGGGCTATTTAIDTMFHGRGSLLMQAGRPRLAYSNAFSATTTDVYYAECLSGCDGGAPTFSTPFALNNVSPNALTRPILRAIGDAGVAYCFRSQTSSISGSLQFGECVSGNCSLPSSWAHQNLDVFIETGEAGAGMDALGALRAVVSETEVLPDGGTNSIYGECTNNCTSNLGTNWTFAQFKYDSRGSAIALQSEGLLMRRSAVWGSDSIGAMLFGECTMNCGSAASWSTVSLGPGAYPDIVMGADGLPRVFYSTSSVPNLATRMTRCTVRPCSVAMNWSAPLTVIAARSTFTTAGRADDGRTTFSTGMVDGGFILGVELPDGGYQTSVASACGAPLEGDSAAAFLRPDGQWNLFFHERQSRMIYVDDAP